MFMEIKCSQCKKTYAVILIGQGTNCAYIYTYPCGRKGHGKKCQTCWYKNVYKKNKETNYIRFKRYEKTKRGFIMRVYRNMKSRIEGIQYKKAHLYAGLSILKREDFYAWALNQKEFHKLFDHWEQCGYLRIFSPSIDRIDTKQGYEIANMRWLTHSENSRLGAISRNKPYQLQKLQKA